MAIKRRKNKLQDLAASGIVVNRVSGSIPFTHDGPNSPLFTISEIPDPAPQGKSSFLIAGTELLKNKVEVKVEIIDSEGGVIYTEPVANYLEGNARRVSIEVYDDTPPGPATLFILAQVDPEEWEDETGQDVTNYPAPSPLRLKGKRRKKRRKKRDADKQKIGQPDFQEIMKRFGFTINPNFIPAPGNDTRFRRRRGRRRRGLTADISDQYNFLQSVKMQIVPTATNTEKIFFYQEPRIKVFEIFKPFVSNIAASGSIVVSGSLTGQVINDTDGSTSTLDSFGATLNTFRRKRKFKKFAGKGGLLKRKRITRRASPEVDNYSFNSETFNFDSKHVGAKINLNNPVVDSTQFPTPRFSIPSTGSFEVLKVKNSSTVIPDKPFRIFDTQLAQSVDASIVSSDFSIEFDPEVTRSISITNFRSYADVRVSNIRTFSGDVFRTKIYRKSEESISDYELFADLPLESSELLLNKNEGTGLERTGYFVSQSDAVDYWEVSQSLVGLTGNDATASAKYDIDKQMDAIHVSGSNYGINEYVKFKLNREYGFTLEKDVNYDFSAELYGLSAPKVVELETGGTEVQQKAELEVYLSGSNIPAQQGNELFGAKLGVIRIDDGSAEKDFGITTGDFESTAKSENCVLTFKVNAGQFYISDVSIRPATETGFSPDLFTFTAPMPQNEIRPETYEFLAEFYDVNNNQADAFTFTATGSTFQGSNMVITGEDNVLESNLFIGGETTASGIHLGGVSSRLPETGEAGAAGSGFMRTVGYTGFTSASNQSLGGKFGFMFFSGSVLPDSGDDYKGVGLELVGASGSFKFRTDPSLFDVRADSFFVGRTGSQFISGSGGDIEISSSDFHLTPEGNVTASALLLGDKPTSFLQFSDSKLEVKSETFFVGNADKAFISGSGNKIEVSSSEFHLTPEGNVTASEMLLGDKAGGNFLQFAGSTLTVQGDISVDSIKTPALIGGSPSTITNASSSIDSQGFASFKSASIAGFVVNPVAIHSADKSLVMSASGQITGSTVLFTGGKIASFTLSDDAFTAGDSFFISSSVENERSFFISSSKFNVKAGGDVTGSSVLFDGGVVGGWTIGDNTLTGGNLILDKVGDIRSADYQSDVKGWLISSQDNGFAEFENAKIRGTLSTTTFEKESVNAVGGQLFIANSTALTGSVVLANATTMSVVNASGFSNGEILQIKKVTNTGFNTEYVKINSASLDGDLSKDELHGRIYVQRALTSTSSSLSASVGDGVGGAQQYEPGQVVVSTGKVGTGYIRLNANPNNQATPYMDIVERTGSNIYDVELKTRVGDLSGVAGSRNVPLGFTGFGIMSEVAFLSGSNIKLEAPSFLLGDLNSSFVSGSNAKIEVSASNFHLQPDGQLLFGDKANNKYIEWNNTNLVVRGDLSVDQLFTPAQIGGATSTFANASASISASGQVAFKGDFLLGGVGDGPFISGSGETNLLEISASNFHLSSSGDVRLGLAPTARVDMTPAQRNDPNVGNYFNTVSSSLQNSTTAAATQGSLLPLAWFRFGAASADYTEGSGNANPLADDEAITDVAVNAQNLTHKAEGSLSKLLRGNQSGGSGIGVHAYNNFISGSWYPKDRAVITSVNNTFTETKFGDTSITLSDQSGGNGHVSIVVWFKPGDITTASPQILVKWGAEQCGMNLYQYQDDIRFDVWNDDGNHGSKRSSVVDTACLTKYQWHCIVAVYKGTGGASSEIQLYVDKVKTTTSLAGTTNIQTIQSFDEAILSIGGLYGDLTGWSYSGWGSTAGDTSSPYQYPFAGWFGEVILMNCALAQADVDTIFDTAFAKTDGDFKDAFVFDQESNSIDIRTKQFVFGLPKIDGFAFISGSDNGQLEISSSNFHVSSSGEVSMTGDINATSGNFKGTLTATGGNIGGFALVSGSDSYISSNTSKTSYTDTSAGVYLGTDGIGLGTGQFKVSAAGALIATSATVTGEINASSGNFTGNISSGAIITGGTLRTADETSGAGKSVKIDGSTNTLQFHGDAGAFNATQAGNGNYLRDELFKLDDSNSLVPVLENAYAKFPGILFPGYDVQHSDGTYDQWTDGGTSNAARDGGLYVPYSYGEGYGSDGLGKSAPGSYVQFTTMLTGHNIGIYRGSRGMNKSSNDSSTGDNRLGTHSNTSNNYDYYHINTPDVYDIAPIRIYQTNGSPSADHGQHGNPAGFGGFSTHGDGGNNHMMLATIQNIISRPNSGSYDEQYPPDTTFNKACRVISGGNAFRHPTSGGEGWQYFQNYETSVVVGGSVATDQVAYGFMSAYWYQYEGSGGSTHTITEAGSGFSETLSTNYGDSNIANAQGGHPDFFVGTGARITPANYSNQNWTTIEAIQYRIKLNSVSYTGNPSAAVLNLQLKVYWDSGGGSSAVFIGQANLASSTVVSTVSSGTTYTGVLNLRNDEQKWCPHPDKEIEIRLTGTIIGGEGQNGSIQVDFGGGSADSYVYAVGQGNYNSRTDDITGFGLDLTNYASGSNNTFYGMDYQGLFGNTHYGYYARIRGADTAYGIRTKVNDSGLLYHIKDEANGLSGGDVYAAYFEGNTHVVGNITYTGDSTQSSDKRLKENIRIVSGSLNLIKQLQTKRFDWKEDYEYAIGPHREGKKDEIGFIAQDVEKIIPELVIESSLERRDYDPDKIGTKHPDYFRKKPSDFTKKFKFLNYEKLIPFLVDAMQEQQEQIEELQKQVKELQEK